MVSGQWELFQKSDDDGRLITFYLDKDLYLSLLSDCYVFCTDILFLCMFLDVNIELKVVGNHHLYEYQNIFSLFLFT